MSTQSDPFEVSKKQKEASGGRKAAGTVFSGWHGLAAGKKGRKLRAAGNEVGGGILGNVAGSAVGGAAGGLAGAATRNPTLGMAGMGVGGLAGTYAGAYQGTKAAQRKGHYKVQKAFGAPQTARRVKAANDVMAFKGSGRKTLKAMDALRPKAPVKKSDPFELEKAFKLPSLGAVKTATSVNAKGLGQIAKPKLGLANKTVRANSRVLGASAKNSFQNASMGTKLGVAGGAGVLGGGAGLLGSRKKQL